MFDCAAKYKSTSLNDNLISGPDLMNSLIRVLMRFRIEQMTLVADVEAMFHQVFAKPSHVDQLIDQQTLTTFAKPSHVDLGLIWPFGHHKTQFCGVQMAKLAQEPVVHRMLVYIFGAKSSPTCANFALKQTAAKFGHLFEPNM